MSHCSENGSNKTWVTRRDAVVAMGTIVVGTSLAGCSGNGDGQALEEYGPQTVQITENQAFDPDELPVGIGGTVIWENNSTLKHTITAYEDAIPDDADYFASGGFDSEQAARDAFPDQGGIPPDESYEHTFEIEGTYEYFSIPHEDNGMKATIQVSAEGPHL